MKIKSDNRSFHKKHKKNLPSKFVFIIIAFILSSITSVLIPYTASASYETAILSICSERYQTLSPAFFTVLQNETGFTEEQFYAGSYIIVTGTTTSGITGQSQILWSGTGQIQVNNSTYEYMTVKTPATNFDANFHFYAEAIMDSQSPYYNNTNYYYAGISPYATTDTQMSSNFAFMNNTAYNVCVADANNLSYDANWQGDTYGVPPTEQIYTMFNVLIDEDGTVTLVYDPTFEDRYNLPPPDQVILALEDSEKNLITADELWSGYAKYNKLEFGQYIAHGYAYYEEDVGYEILDTVFLLNVDGTAFSIIYNENEDSYCSIKNGYEWNCSIPQGDDEETLIDGSPEVWTAEECSITSLGGCVRNIIHFIGEYLGINSPPTSNISKNFLSFETSTYGLSSILTAPLSLIQSLSSQQCSSVVLPLPYVDEDLTLPCMTTIYNNMFGNVFMTLYQTITTGVIAYWIVVDLFATVKSFKDPDEDRIEVVNL